MAITKYDQFVKDLKELESIELTIHDKKVDLKLRGTYKQIKTQYRSLSKKLHEDAWKKNGITSEEDKNKARAAIRCLTGVYGYIDKDKKDNNRQDDDVCTIIEDARGAKRGTRSSSRSRGAYSSANNSRSRSSYYGPNSSRQSSGNSHQGTQNGTNRSSTGQRSYSSSSSSYSRQQSSSSSNQRTNSSSSSKDVDTIVFNNGTLKKVLDSRNAPKRLEGQSNVYVYEFTDKRGETHKIYSENTFKELSNPDMKTHIEDVLLSSFNINRAKSYDVQDEDSQYGYVGKLVRTGISYYEKKLDSLVIRSLRNKELKEVKELRFNNGTIKRLLDESGKQKRLEDLGNVYGYEYTSRSGKKHIIYSENTFEELSTPEIKSSVDSLMLSAFNIRNAESHDVQDDSSQYGYVGKIVRSGYKNFDKKIDASIVRVQRSKELKKLKELEFNGGKLKRVYNERGGAKTLDGYSSVYEYEYVDKIGKKHVIYSDNSFEELSMANIKPYVENWLLSPTNIRNAESYNVQDENSQYGYVGKIVGHGYNSFERRIDASIVRVQRSKELKELKELEFNGGKLKRVYNERGGAKTLDGYSSVYEYEYINGRGDSVFIYSDNTFEELSSPRIKSDVEFSLFSPSNMRNARSYDPQDENAQYGYVGKLMSYGHSSFERRIDNSVVRTLRNRQANRSNINNTATRDSRGQINNHTGNKKLNITMAMDDLAAQKTITLKNGSKLYGYRLFDENVKGDKGKELYIEDSPIKLADKMKSYKTRGYDNTKMMQVFDEALQNAYDFSTTSSRAQFGYAGSLGDDGKFEVNPRIIEELRDRIRVIAARNEFMNLAGREDKLLEELRDSGR